MLISPNELKLSEHVKTEVIKKNGMEYVETTDLESAMPELDVLYMTRVQGERFADQSEYLRLRDSYILTLEKLNNAKKDLSILHPLPRVNEISVKVDDDPRACYFKQVSNAKYMRMALILKLLDEAKQDRVKAPLIHADAAALVRNRARCQNPRCISMVEQELEQIFVITDPKKNVCRCVYCETAAELK